MVVIHEFGHFIFAKLFRVTVLEFSIGMGPALFTTKKSRHKKAKKEGIELANTFRSGDDGNVEVSEAERQGTVFSVRALPIGGYVSMAGEDDSSDDENAFCNKPVWQRFIITVAGPIMNILLGVI